MIDALIFVVGWALSGIAFFIAGRDYEREHPEEKPKEHDIIAP